jgi:putative membrane protein
MFCNRFGAGGYGSGGPNFFMMIPMLIILLLVAYFIYKAISSKNLNFAVDTSSSKAMAILNERFAKGEINEEEYANKKNQLLK